MSSIGSEGGGRPQVPEIIRPGPDAEKALNIAEDAQRKKEKPATPVERLEARVDSHIAELRDDKSKLQDEIRWLRTNEITHLREDIRQRIVSEVPTARHRLPKGQCRHFGYNALN